MFRLYFEPLAGSRRLAALCLVLLVFAGLAEALGIAAMLPLLSSNLTSNAGGKSEWLGLRGDELALASASALVTFGLLGAVLKYFADSRLFVVQASVERSLRSKMVTALLNMRWSDYLHVTLGDGVKAAVTDGSQIALGAYAFVQGVGFGVIALILMAAAFLINPIMTAAVVLFGGGMAALYRRAGHRSRDLSREMAEKAGLIQESTTDLLANAKYYRSTGLEQRALDRLYDQFADWANRFVSVQHFMPMTRLGAESAGLAFIAVVLVVTITVLGNSIADALVFLALFYRLAPRLQAAQQLLLTARTQEAWWTAWKKRHDECVALAEPATGVLEVAKPPTIEFDHVSLTYPTRSVPALRDVSCVIEPGQRLAVVGESGAGKTTMLDIVTGLVVPTSGAVRLDGVELTAVERTAWRRRIGVVMQDSPVFHGTVLENIAFADDVPEEQRAWRAAEIAHLTEVINALPNGIHSQLGQKGATLSGGQRQRLALARALYAKPWLLILDEATSALDTRSEQVIQDALDLLRGECSMLIVAHRLKTVQISDHILVLSGGKIVEEGSWADLAAGGGLFQTMLMEQMTEARG